jgi:hypothetical protein
VLGGVQDREVPGGSGNRAYTKALTVLDSDLMELPVDTTWWTRYRSRNKNPDFGDTFPSAVPGLMNGKSPLSPEQMPT